MHECDVRLDSKFSAILINDEYRDFGAIYVCLPKDKQILT